MKEQLLPVLETSKNYTLAVAEAMPDNAYNTRPADTVWKFGELLNHIAYGIQWWEANYIKGIKTDWAPPAVKASKKEIIAYLNKAYESLKGTISNGKLDEEKVRGFHATLDHITHHRGQAVTYLRYKDIVPPEYTY